MTMLEKTCSVILAAGDGKRMKSARPKVLCQVLFKPMINWVADSCLAAGIPHNSAVLGENADMVREVLPGGFSVCLQAERRGTGHAVMMAADFIRESGAEHVLVAGGDAPFLSAGTIRDAYSLHLSSGAAVTLVTAKIDEPAGYGRILRSGNRVIAIVEEADADDAEKAITEVNSGAYWFESRFLLEALARLDTGNAQGECYLTDTVEAAFRQGLVIQAYTAPDPDIVLGANDRRALQKLNQTARRRVLDRLLDGGVDIPLEDGVMVGVDVSVGPDTRLLPGTVLQGGTSIGSGCVIGPNSVITDSRIGDGCVIDQSRVDRSRLGRAVHIGPFTNIRPNSDLDDRVKIGDFVEVKNSTVGENTSIAHLTYIGDTDLGKRCNIGCGVVTVNYDGTNKFRTQVGDDSFVGCNTNLVAPVRMGDRTYSAAGTTVTENVPDDALVIGRARQVVKENWSKTRGRFKGRK